jgi:hypothetical protein
MSVNNMTRWIDEILKGQFQQREASLASEWVTWERKTLNMHRGILHFTALAGDLEA